MYTKQRVIFLSSVLLILATAFGCQKERGVQGEPSQKEGSKPVELIVQEINQKNPLAQIGIGHNEVLDKITRRVYPSLKSSSVELALQRVKEEAKIEFNRLMSEIKGSERIYQDAHIDIDKVFDDVVAIVTQKDEWGDLGIVPEHNLVEISLAQRDILEDIERVIVSEADLRSALKEFEYIQDVVLAESPEGEKELLLATLAVAVNTSYYWSRGENTFRAFSWKKLGKADIRGAVEGAIACGIARLFGPIGWKAWMAGIVGTAAAASAGYAVEEALN